MPRPLKRSSLLASALMLVSLTGRAQEAPAVLSEATRVRSYDGREMSAELVRITVPERRAHPGRSVTVTALLLPTVAEEPGRPIVFLMGGPGIPGTEMASVPPYFTLFQRLCELGDVVLVDQRGIGRSEPVLDCPLEGSLPVDTFVAPDELVAYFRQQVAACAERWRRQGAEPTADNSLESADDIEDLRTALGFEQIDLLAFSYGTRLALVFVQRHTAHVGRVVLQGVNRPGLVVKRPVAVARKLQRLGELLKDDPTWQGPTDLVGAARSARERLARSAAVITVSGRDDGKPVELRVGREGFDAIVGLNLDDARLPALLVSVAAGDDRVLTRFTEAAWNGLAGGTVGLMARAVNCAADRPEARWELVAQECATAPFGAPFDNAFLSAEFCRAIGYDVPAVEFPGPVKSGVPALLLTGELDATNPIENARDVAAGLENAVVLEVENVAHEALPVPVVQDVVIDFLKGVDVRGRQLAGARPDFASVEEALQPSPRRGR